MDSRPSTQSSTSSATTVSKINKKTAARHPHSAGLRRRKRGRLAGNDQRPETAAVAHDDFGLHGACLSFGDSGPSVMRGPGSDAQRAATDFMRPASSEFWQNPRIGGGSEVEFVDEEAMFNMPLMMDCMAEAMLLTPPALKKGFDWSQNLDDNDDVDLTLWRD